MSATLTINGHSTDAPAGVSLFDLAERLGVQVPTSCKKNGKCKECIVEVAEGKDLLTPPTSYESHLRGNFRLSCQWALGGDEGEVRGHGRRGGQMRSEGGALGLPESVKKVPLEPCVTR